MTSGPERAPAPERRLDERAAVRAERFELLNQIQEILEPLMILLGLIFLGLVIVEYSGMHLTAEEHRWLDHGETAIYWIFIAEFAVRLAIAPDKLPFLRQNWLTVLSLALPLLRPLRVLRAAPAFSTIQTVRVLSGANQGLRALRTITRGRQLVYVVIVTITFTLLGAGSVLYLDRRAAETPFHSFGEALWWAATLVTTINSSDDPVSSEGRIVAVLLRIYAVSIFGYITASIASYFIGKQSSVPAPGAGSPPGTATPPPAAATPSPAAHDLHRHLADVEREIARLRQELVARAEGATTAADPPPPTAPATTEER